MTGDHIIPKRNPVDKISKLGLVSLGAPCIRLRTAVLALLPPVGPEQELIKKMYETCQLYISLAFPR